jgi:hypothetical protein
MKCLSVMVAILWLPMAAHCQLESLPGLEFLACQTGDTASENSDSHCGEVGCCSVERAEYKTGQFRPTPPSPNWLPISPALLLTLARAMPDEIVLCVVTAAPPQLAAGWRFSSRTALPPRAPSIAS